VTGVTNVIADAFFRDGPVNSDWSLDRKSFLWMCSLNLVLQEKITGCQLTSFQSLTVWQQGSMHSWLTGTDGNFCGFKGFWKDVLLQRESLRRCAILAQSTLVSLTHVQIQGIAPIPRTSLTPEGRYQHFLVHLKNPTPPSYVDFFGIRLTS